MRQGVLAKVVLAAMDQPEFKAQLLQAPADVATHLKLDRDDVRELSAVGEDGFDAIVGSLIVHRMLPFPVGKQLMIAPISYGGSIDTDRQIIRLDQGREGAWLGVDGTSQVEGRVFGGGSHPTTALSLEALESTLQPGEAVLDLGCGSGVVAIAAAKLGGEPVHACDIDPFAAQVSRENVFANQLGRRITVSMDSFETLMDRVGPAAFDVVVSNILSHVHQANLEHGMAELLRPGGRLIISGFRDNKVDDLAETLADHGIKVVSVGRNGFWRCIVGQLGGTPSA